MSVLSLLNKTCSITAKTPSISTTTGSVVYAESTTTGVLCAVQTKVAGQQDHPFQAGETVYNFYFPYGTTCAVSSKLSAVSDFTNYEFQVVSETQDDVGRNAYTRVRARHVQAGAIL